MTPPHHSPRAAAAAAAVAADTVSTAAATAAAALLASDSPPPKPTPTAPQSPQPARHGGRAHPPAQQSPGALRSPHRHGHEKFAAFGSTEHVSRSASAQHEQDVQSSAARSAAVTAAELRTQEQLQALARHYHDPSPSPVVHSAPPSASPEQQKLRAEQQRVDELLREQEDRLAHAEKEEQVLLVLL